MVDVRQLVWDPGNIAHIARHGVTPRDVEDVCFGEHVTLTTYYDRSLLIGLTRNGRFVAAIIEAVSGHQTYYAVSARPASRKERRYYREQIEGDSS